MSDAATTSPIVSGTGVGRTNIDTKRTRTATALLAHHNCRVRFRDGTRRRSDTLGARRAQTGDGGETIDRHE